MKIIEIPQSKSEVNALQRQGMSERDVTEYFYKMVEDIVEEIVLMSKLKGNSNIVSYEDHSVVPKKDGLGWDIYIRMEILTPLITHIRENKMTVRNVIRLGIDICQALEVCQKYNIIHCDIKPENIFVSNNGTYKLGDFGIARQLEKSSSMLSQKGTFSYMAPEVYKGEKYNSTVDIYSLGIVLYRFLNQNRIPFLLPYPEQTRFTDRKKANIMRFSGQPIPPPKFASEDLSKIILKACSYNEGDRYRNAADLRKDLESLKNIDENPLNYIHEELSSKTEFIDNNSLAILMKPYYLMRNLLMKKLNVLLTIRDLIMY